MKVPFTVPCCGSRDKHEVPQLPRATKLPPLLSKTSVTQNAAGCRDLPQLEAFGTVEQEEEAEESDVDSVNTEDRQAIEEARALMNKEVIARGGRATLKKSESKVGRATLDMGAAVDCDFSPRAPPNAKLCTITSFPDSSAAGSAEEASIDLMGDAEAFRTSYSRVSRRIETLRQSVEAMDDGDGDPQALVRAVKERIAKSLREEEQSNDTMTQVEREAITRKISQLQEEESAM